MTVTPFTISVPDGVLDDLSARLRNVRWPGEPADAGWRYGANLAYMQRLVTYWREQYDWRAAEARLNGYAQYRAPVDADGGAIDLHFIHERADDPTAQPLLMLHGWPGSVAEFTDFIGPLAHPERFGGDPSRAFHVVAPSLPGYGFSAAPAAPMRPSAMAELFQRLMTEVLGYDRYGAQGGDWGSLIIAWMAARKAQGLRAAHLNMVPFRPPLGDGTPPLSADEERWLAEARARRRRESAYQDMHATKSQTAAVGLTDSPAGLAAWIVEKFHAWSDPEAAAPPFTMDQLLTNVMVYWVTGCINSSMWLYRAFREEGPAELPPGGLELPLGFCLPANDLVPPPPASWLKRLGNVARDTRLDGGGHFTALQMGPELARDIRSFFHDMAPAGE